MCMTVSINTCRYGVSLTNDLFLIFIDEIAPTMTMTWFIMSHMSRCIVKASVAWSILCLL